MSNSKLSNLQKLKLAKQKWPLGGDGDAIDTLAIMKCLGLGRFANIGSDLHPRLFDEIDAALKNQADSDGLDAYLSGRMRGRSDLHPFTDLPPPQLNNLAKALGVPELFDLTTKKDVLRALADAKHNHAVKLLVRQMTLCKLIDSNDMSEHKLDGFEPTQAERDLAVNVAATWNQRQQSAPQLVFQSMDAGASTVALTLASERSIIAPPHVSRVFVLQAVLGCEGLSDQLQIVHDKLQQTATDLRLTVAETSRSSPGIELFNLLLATGAHLIILGAQNLTANGSRTLWQLSRAAQKAEHHNRKPVVTYFSRGGCGIKTGGQVLNLDVRRYTGGTDQEREAALGRDLTQLFAQYQRFRKGTKTSISQSDFRRSWWEWRLADQPAEMNTIAEIRAVSFFGTNTENASFYDPTGGWDVLAGMKAVDLPLEIAMLRTEWMSQIAATHTHKNARHWSDLKLLSTSVYWMNNQIFRGLTSLGLANGDRREAEVTRPYVLTSFPIGKEEDAYGLSLALKALVQTVWMGAPEGSKRQDIHFKTGSRLARQKDVTHEKLTENFPLSFKSDVHPVVNWTEAIRHLVRALPAHPVAGAKPPADLANPKLPNSPADHEQLAHYIYEQLLQRELNDNHPGHDPKHKLSSHYGAYRTSVEIHDLLASYFDKARPVWFDHVFFARMRAYALIEFGKLPQALQLLEATEKSKMARSGRSVTSRIYLDLCLVHREMGHSEEANIWLKRAQKNDPAPDDLPLQVRLLTRNAMLLLDAGKVEQAMDRVVSAIRLTDPTVSIYRTKGETPVQRRDRLQAVGRLTGDDAHVAIDCLLAKYKHSKRRDTDVIEAALYLCTANMRLERYGQDRHAELGFRVQRATCYRLMKLLDPCEADLDRSFTLLYKYGCSERTFVSLLAETGKMLWHLGHCEKSYAQYLVPCITRACQGGFYRRGQVALKKGKKSYKIISARMKKAGDDWPVQLQNAITSATHSHPKSVNMPQAGWRLFSNYVERDPADDVHVLSSKAALDDSLEVFKELEELRAHSI